MTRPSDVLRYTAFSDDPAGGNPAGVLLEAGDLSDEEMQTAAAELGYSESAFVTGPITPAAPVPIRYFAPEGEVPFCGHATIATAAAIAEQVAPGRYELSTAVGPVRISGEIGESGGPRGSLETPATGHAPLSGHEVDALLTALDWSPSDLRTDLPPGLGLVGNRHPVLVAHGLERLETLAYDFEALQLLCREKEWITVQLVVETGEGQWRSRNPFPYGGVVEDPATGSAAAAFTGYLRGVGRLRAGENLVIDQGVEMGRPSRIEVTCLDEGARITGQAVAL